MVWADFIGCNGVHATLPVNMNGKARTFPFSGSGLMAMHQTNISMMKNELFVHVGKMVDKELYCQEIAKKEFAYRVEIDRSNLYRILKKESMDTYQLFLFSKELNHNFFRDLANEFDRLQHIGS